MSIKTAEKQCYIDANSKGAFLEVSDALFYFITQSLKCGYKTIVFVCIGTDRSTGDSLGPLIGYKLWAVGQKYRHVYIHGTLENPVHAKNLKDVMDEIKQKYEKPLIIAIDACLGQMNHIGWISVGQGPIRPGSGVNKELDPVGDVHITGIVNFGGFMDFLILQNTRLCTVMKMADIISLGIKYTLSKVNIDTDGNRGDDSFDSPKRIHVCENQKAASQLN